MDAHNQEHGGGHSNKEGTHKDERMTSVLEKLVHVQEEHLRRGTSAEGVLNAGFETLANIGEKQAEISAKQTQIMTEQASLLTNQTAALKSYNETLAKIGDNMVAINTSVGTAVTNTDESKRATQRMEEAVKELPARTVAKANEVKNWDNLKGDVRTGVVTSAIMTVLGALTYAIGRATGSEAPVMTTGPVVALKPRTGT